MSEVYTKIAHIYTNTGKEVKVVDSTGRIIHEASRLITVTGVPPISFTKSIGKPLVSWDLLGNGEQNGTPTPDNPVMPTFCGVRTAQLFDKTATNTNNGYIPNGYVRSDGMKNTNRDYRASEYIAINANDAYTLYCVVSLNTPSVCFYDSNKNFISGESYSGRVTIPFTTPQDAAFLRLSYRAIDGDAIMLNSGSTALPYEPYGWAEKITCAGQTVPVYLGQTQTVRRIRKLVLDGTENIAMPTTSSFQLFNIIQWGDINGFCSHYSQITWSEAVAASKNGFAMRASSGGADRVRICDLSITTVEDFRSYLAAQYAAGTPVTIWYVLATPQTAIVNEPLAKIGDYADELHSTDAAVTIPTAKGNNTLTVDTDLPPSSMTIVYKGKP